MAIAATVSGPPPVDATKSNHLSTATHHQSPLHLPLTSPRIVVKKSERRLFLYDGNKLVKTYRIGLGHSPEGNKVREGDRRTPEGDFYIFTKNDKSAFYLSLGVSYPNAAHARRGLRDGLISKSQHDAIIRALKLKKTPPQKHGFGWRHLHPWSWRCQRLDLGLRGIGERGHARNFQCSHRRHARHNSALVPRGTLLHRSIIERHTLPTKSVSALNRKDLLD